ncbi:MAG: hypothetical protein KDA28_15205, partial [Phycisphaerales bacterium]|nr:hypothetical protein [Phycisphaerales bacterium]
NLSLHFHTGSSISTQLMRQHAISTRYLVNRYPYRCGYYDLYGYHSPYRHYAIQGYYTPDPSLVASAPAPAPSESEAAAPPPTPLEVGAAAMQAGELEVAIDAYKEHLRDQPEDAWAMRQLGICLMESDRIEDGIAVVRHAYRTDPMLAEQPVARMHFALDTQRLRALVNRSVRYAHRTGSASAWLGVTALMQAEGRRDVARRMLDRAEEAGLETEIATRFAAALR